MAMHASPAPGDAPVATGPGADEFGELHERPLWVVVAWSVLAGLAVTEAMREVAGLPGPDSLYEQWIHDGVLVGATVLVLARAAVESTARRAWLAFGVGMALWAAGTVAWSVVYGSRSTVPYPTFADVLWLAWYPLTALGVVELIRLRFDRFEWHRWMDGIAVVLMALAFGFALVIEPAAHETTQRTVATVVDFSYPVLDVLLTGTVLGVYALLGWRPDGMWVLIGLGVLAMTGADAAFAVQEARGVANDSSYAFVWTFGALALALAAWARTPDAPAGTEAVTGLRAVALPLVAQALAIGVQIYALVHEVGKSERVVTILVLVIASVQIVLTRPRRTAPAVVDEPSGPAATATAPPLRDGSVDAARGEGR
jgi:hypothetical protein